MSEATEAERPPTRRALTVGLWIVQGVLAFQFAGAGVMKLMGAPEMVTLFADIGAGQGLRYVVGALEVAGAVGLLVPRLAGLAALGLVGLMLGATFTNIVVIDASPVLPLVLAVAAAVVVRARWSQIVALLRSRR